MTERNDHDLGEQFHALRREDAAATPPFHATLAAARARHAPPSGRRARWLAAAAVGVAGVALALLSNRPHPGAGGAAVTIDLATVRWEAPTDFLLTLPGEELLRAVPELGRPPSTRDRRIP